MPIIEVDLRGDGAWPDLRDLRDHGELVHLSDTTWHLAALEAGMQSGSVSLALRLDLPRNRLGPFVVITETSLAAWITATCALRARFPASFAGTPLELDHR